MGEVGRLVEFLAGGFVEANVFGLRPDYRAMLVAVDGLVPSPSDDASDTLLANLDSEPLAEPLGAGGEVLLAVLAGQRDAGLDERAGLVDRDVLDGGAELDRPRVLARDSDADQLARLTFLPGGFYVFFFLLVGVGSVVAGAYLMNPLQ